MLDIFNSLFGSKATQSAGSTEDRIYLATCAVLLEIAYIDGEFSDVERSEITSIMKKRFDLKDEHIVDLIKTAEEEIKKSIDVWRFSTQINKAFERDEKLELVEMIWKLVLVDGHMDGHEEYLAKKVAGLLGISHPEMIEAKRKAISAK